MRVTKAGWVLLGAALGGCGGETIQGTGANSMIPSVGTAGVAAPGGSIAPSAGSVASPTTGVAGSAPSARPTAGSTATAVAGSGAGGVAAIGGAAAAGSSASAGSGAGGVAAVGGAAGAVASAGTPAAGGGAPEPGGFPKTDEVNIKSTGPYAVKTYTEGLAEPTYASSMMYYPEGATPPYAVIAFTPGFTATKENYTFLGFMLASHGFAALLTTPTSTSDQPPARGTDLEAAVKRIQAENTRQGSPLLGKLAVDRICVTGHSMGGGGTLYAANALGDKIRCAMPLQPWQPGGSFPKITAPIMFIGAASDTIASVSGNAQPHYQSIPNTTEKFLAVFEGDHYLSTNRTSTDQMAPEEATPSFDIQAAYIIPFYKLFLEDDERYRPFLYGDMRSMMGVTKFEKSK